MSSKIKRVTGVALRYRRRANVVKTRKKIQKKKHRRRRRRRDVWVILIGTKTERERTRGNKKKEKKKVDGRETGPDRAAVYNNNIPINNISLYFINTLLCRYYYYRPLYSVQRVRVGGEEAPKWDEKKKVSYEIAGKIL